MSDMPLDEGLAALLETADQRYERGDWLSARLAYQVVAARCDAAGADRLALLLAIGHCAIELAGPAEIDALPLALGSPTTSPRELALKAKLRARAVELCHLGRFGHACRLLRLLAVYDWPIADAYAHFVVGAGAAAEPAPAGPPPFLATALTPERLAGIRAGFAGTRVLGVLRRYIQRGSTRRNELADYLTDSARAFGLDIREINSHILEPGDDVAGFLGRLRDAIDGFQPSLILYDDLFETGLTSNDMVAAAVTELLRGARRDRGCRVVKTFPDAWWGYAMNPESLFRGLGDCLDLIHHCHPTILGAGTPEQQARTYCYLYPVQCDSSGIDYGTIGHGAFIGGIDDGKPARMVVWAEAARAGLPITFHVGIPPWGAGAAIQAPTDDYFRQLREHRAIVNLTRRSSGVTILVQRTIETLMMGGVLIEEDSVDTRHFFAPGSHYLPFTTLAELDARLSRALADPALCAALSRDGQNWAKTYFTGDHYWAGLLAAAFPERA